MHAAPKLKSSELRDAKLEKHCIALAEVIVAIRPVYAKIELSQKALIETMIGAAIWYVPKPSNAWTGNISLAALSSFHPNSGTVKPKFSEEHVYPRKVAARMLLEDVLLDGKRMAGLFREKYGRLHYITPDENKSVQKFQRAGIFISPEEAYSKAGITFVQATKEDLSLIKKRDLATIEQFLKAVSPT